MREFFVGNFLVSDSKTSEEGNAALSIRRKILQSSYCSARSVGELGRDVRARWEEARTRQIWWNSIMVWWPLMVTGTHACHPGLSDLLAHIYCGHSWSLISFYSRHFLWSLLGSRMWIWNFKSELKEMLHLHLIPLSTAQKQHVQDQEPRRWRRKSYSIFGTSISHKIDKSRRQLHLCLDRVTSNDK